MPKVDRILGYLPLTFRAGVDPSALRAVVGAFGNELQNAENSLAAVMQSHWIDFADLGSDEIVDLACIGSLYGLLPRDDETVEECRDHLRRHIRAFLDGTVTVQGLLRVTASALHLGIDDEYAAIDAWWDRTDAPVVTSRPSGADAATAVLGVGRFRRDGADAGPAVVVGRVDLRGGVDLRPRRLLWLELDGGGTVPVDLTASATDAALVQADEIVAAINDHLGVDVATIDDGRLRLTSTSVGPSAAIIVADGDEDAAVVVLGLPPRTYEGADATHAAVVGTADLSAGVDLTTLRYVRIRVDGTRLAEIDLTAAAADPGAATTEEITQAINAAFGDAIASHDGQFVTLTSPTPGAAGSIAFLSPAAQDATSTVFDDVPTVTSGADAHPALAAGTVDIGLGVDLTERSTMRLAVDGEPAVTVDVAGADPAATLSGEIVTSLNTGLGDTIATHDGRFVTLRSPVVGADGLVVIDDVADDAAESVLGTPSRTFGGRPPANAAFTGAADLTAGVDLSARRYLVLSLDGGPPTTVDLHTSAADVEAVTLDELAAAINGALGAPVATDDGAHLILVSPTNGAAGSIELVPLVEQRARRFLSHALVTDDAGTKIFGFTDRTAVGTEATAARIVGANDLLGGVDLRDRPIDDGTASAGAGRHLRLAIDGGDAIEIDCAGPRPRATTTAEIVAAIDAAAEASVSASVASTDGHLVTLVSPTVGADSRIALEPTRARDASEPLGLTVGLARGTDAGGVSFAAIPDLAAGVSLAADATIAIGVDGGAPTDVVVGDVDPPERSLSQIVAAINVALSSQVASHDGTHLHLTSPTRGAGAGIEIAAPSTGTDVTADLFGVEPRAYSGAAATAAVVSGSVDLGAADPLGRRVFLALAVDGDDPVTIDLGSRAADPEAPSPAEIATAINVALDSAQASIVGGRLRISSTSTGSASRIEITRSSVGDARALIFGEVATDVSGEPARPATLTGERDLLRPVGLEDGSIIRLAVDGAPAVDVDVAGGSPNATVLVEIVAAIDAIFPGVASETADQRLELVSPTTGPESSIALVALRRLEIQEYPPERSETVADVAHGTRFVVDNRGAVGSAATFTLEASAGTVGPRITALDRPWSVRVDEAVQVGERLDVELADDRVAARITGASGEVRAVPPDAVHVRGAAEDVLQLARGRNRLTFTECDDARFDASRFDEHHFAGGPCVEIGVFDVSAFSDAPSTRTSFAEAGHVSPASRVTVAWDEHRAGALAVNLPEQLDERYGVRFGEGRFGSADAERFDGVVTEPVTDERHLLAVVNAGSGLVEAHLAPRVPIGWSAVALPFRDPQPLTLGTSTREARIYLSEDGLGSEFLELRARHVGSWANAVTVTARQSGPAIYDLAIHYPGGRLENARAIVAGWPPVAPLHDPPARPCQAAATITDASSGDRDGSAAAGVPTLASELGAPGPVGVLVAKAAGVRADVTRDGVRSAGDPPVGPESPPAPHTTRDG